jgi:hypothetical protein
LIAELFSKGFSCVGLSLENGLVPFVGAERGSNFIESFGVT